MAETLEGYLWRLWRLPHASLAGFTAPMRYELVRDLAADAADAFDDRQVGVGAAAVVTFNLAGVDPGQVAFPLTLVLLLDACFKLLCGASHAAATVEYRRAWRALCLYVDGLMGIPYWTLPAHHTDLAAATYRGVCESVRLEAPDILARASVACPLLARAAQRGLERSRVRITPALGEAEILVAYRWRMLAEAAARH